MIGKREGYDFDVEAVVAACAEHGTFLEINAQPHRLDLRPAHARLAVAAGVKLVISTDAHRMAALDYQELGVSMARRAGATRDDVANARPFAETHGAAQAGQGRSHVSEPDDPEAARAWSSSRPAGDWRLRRSGAAGTRCAGR